MATVETGVTPLGENSEVAWTRQRIPDEHAALLRYDAANRTYRVTTLREIPDGTIVLGTFRVPGSCLGLWLERLRGSGEDLGTVVSVEVV